MTLVVIRQITFPLSLGQRGTFTITENAVSARGQERSLLEMLCFSLAKAVTYYVNALV